jgi:hypothetical protein
MSNAWLEVDREGLAKTLEGKPKAFVLFEAIQNALDEKGVTKVDVTVERIPGSPFAVIRVEDDAPEGWSDLTHAYRMFAESKKKGDATLRGRFNVGEKWILALSRKAMIVTTTGTLIFDEDGRRKSATKTERGSTLTVEVRMTDEEMEEALALASCVLPPPTITLSINGEQRWVPAPLRTVEATLPTVISGDDGVLRPTERKTTVSIHKPNLKAHGTRFVYEMGIPVVEIECEWDVDVAQRVPLNVDRDNITPAYKRKVLALVVNEMAREIKDAGAGWVQEAISSPDIEADALGSVLDKRYTEKRVMFDPSDPEANKLAVASGYTVVHGRSLGGDAAANVRRFRDKGLDLLKPAGQVTPSSAGTWAARSAANPDAPVMDPVDPSRYGEFQIRAVAFIKRIGERILGCEFPVAIFPSYPMGVRIAASWSASGLLGLKRFSLYNPGMRGRWEDRDYLLGLVIHECAHDKASDHLSEEYYEALTSLGVKAVVLALTEPGLFAL